MKGRMCRPNSSINSRRSCCRDRTIRGQVRDPSGAVIPKSRLVLNGLYESVTNQNGEYEFSAVSPGIYELRAEALGFLRYELVAVPVEADRITQADIVLVLGSVRR